MINDSENAYHNTLDTLCVYIPLIMNGGSTMQLQNSHESVQFIYIHVHAFVSLFVNCFLLFEASWKIDVLSNEWPFEIKSLLVVVLSFDNAVSY